MIGSVRWHPALRLFPCLSALVIAVLQLTAAPDAKSLPSPTGYVSDFAHVLNPSDKQTLEDFCTKVEKQLGVQFALVTVDTIGDAPIEDYGLDLFRHWGIGSRKDNSGVLLLIAVKDHKDRVQTGRGIEPYLTDGFSGSTLRSMSPDLRASNYGAALLAGAHEIAAQIAQGKGISFDGNARLPQPGSAPPAVHITIQEIFFGIIILIFILNLFRGGGRGGGYRGGGGGFWTGFLLSSLLNSGGRRGGDWGGGGFGGDSGGGGGFGGFGGGDTGGGGASGSW